MKNKQDILYMFTNEQKKELFDKGRKNIAKRIVEDKDFIVDYLDVIKTFSTINTMMSQLADDLIVNYSNGDLDEKTAKMFAEEWVDWILKL